MRLAGIGGTGVVTVSQVLGMAALIDGLEVAGLDQTGLSQKGGPVLSDLRLAQRSDRGRPAPIGRRLRPVPRARRPRRRRRERALAACDRGRTLAVVSASAVPTGAMVTDPGITFPSVEGGVAAITRTARDSVVLDAQALSEQLFGDHMQANVLALGAAFQRGALPLSAAAIEAALELNGAGAERNLAAFAWGRAVVANPAAVAAATAPPERPEPLLDPQLAKLADRCAGTAPSELRRLVEVRLADLWDYQGMKLAARYADVVAEVRAVEAERAPGSTALAEAVARSYHRLRAYKDEYEVARLHLDAAEEARRDAAFGAGAKVIYHLHPPLLRALGMKRKLRLGEWFTPALQMLRACRRIRGTALDPFGLTTIRRTERALIGEYEEHVRFALRHLSPDSIDGAVALCAAAEEIRGYEQIKLDSVARYRIRADELRAELAAAASQPLSSLKTGTGSSSPRTRTSPAGSHENAAPAAETAAGVATSSSPSAASSSRAARFTEVPK